MEKDEVSLGSMLAVLEEEGPLAKCPAYTYTRVVRENFEKICLMRKKRFSYLQIWKALKKLEALPEHSNAHSFRQAFNREWRKQGHEKDLEAFFKTDPKANIRMKESGTGTQKIQQPTVCKPEEKTGNADAEALERERRKKLGLGRRINTGNGTIIKNTDGTFDYD